ncbi:MAG TPA: protein kinase, partial [Deinococcales bacterium]|nr:protein kinase [Deinococcales bacterium]
MSLGAARYQRVRELGQGATARVDLALDLESQALVAIKRLLVPGGRSGARLRREYRALGRLRHENVVRVLDLGEAEGVPFIVMEYVPGLDLSAWLAGTPSLDKIV